MLKPESRRKISAARSKLVLRAGANNTLSDNRFSGQINFLAIKKESKAITDTVIILKNEIQKLLK